MRNVLLSIICGICITDLLIANVSWTVSEQVFVLGILTLALFVSHYHRALLPFSICMTLFYFVFGSTLFLVRYDNVRHALPAGTKAIQGEIIEAPKAKAKTTAVKVRTDEGATVLCYLAAADSLAIGDFIEAYSPYGFSSTCQQDNPDSVFGNYYNYLFYQGISATCYFPKGTWQLTGRGGDGIYSRLRTLQTYVSSKYDSAGFTGDEGSVIRAMTVGDNAGMSKSLKRQFSAAGVSHILALSGFHLSVIYMILDLFLFSVFVPIGWRWITRLIIIACITAYVVMAGAPPSLVRAAIMYSIMIVCQSFRRAVLSLDSLVFAAAVMLIADPLLLFSVSFQFSFLSMFGLITAGNSIYSRIKIRNGVARKIVTSVSSTVICSIFTFPLVGYYFGTIPTMSIVSNLLVCLLATALMVIASVWWLFFFAPPVQSAIGWVLMSVTSVITAITDKIASMEWATLEWHPNKISVVLCYLALLAIYLLIRRINPKIA